MAYYKKLGKRQKGKFFLMRPLHKLGENNSHTGSLETTHTQLQSLEELREWKLESS